VEEGREVMLMSEGVILCFLLLHLVLLVNYRSLQHVEC